MQIIRNVGAVIAAMLLIAGSATAQDAGVQRRTEMSRELISLSVGPNFVKQVEQYMVAQIDKADEGEGTAEAAWARANMPAMTTRMMTRMLDAMAPLYARTFSEEELAAQIDFYRSPLGRSVAAKTVQLGIAQEELMQEVMVAFLSEFEAKYCAQFDCEAGGGQMAVKPSRR